LGSERPPPPFYFEAFSEDNWRLIPPPIPPIDSYALAQATSSSGTAAVAETVPLGNPTASTSALSNLEQTFPLQQLQYGGSIAQKRRRPYEASKDYKACLKGLLSDLLKVTLGLASDVPPRDPIEQSFMSLNETLAEIHRVLGEYRMHEAREKLLVHSKQELARLQTLDEQIKDILTSLTSSSGSSAMEES